LKQYLFLIVEIGVYDSSDKLTDGDPQVVGFLGDEADLPDGE